MVMIAALEWGNTCEQVPFSPENCPLLIISL